MYNPGEAENKSKLVPILPRLGINAWENIALAAKKRVNLKETQVESHFLDLDMIRQSPNITNVTEIRRWQRDCTWNN